MLFPFEDVEDVDVRRLDVALMLKHPTPPITADGMKHVVLEMYTETRARETGRLRALADEACLPFFHLSVEEWDCERSRRKFLGVRLFWMEEWNVCSANLAVSVAKGNLGFGYNDSPSRPIDVGKGPWALGGKGPAIPSGDLFTVDSRHIQVDTQRHY